MVYTVTLLKINFARNNTKFKMKNLYGQQNLLIFALILKCLKSSPPFCIHQKYFHLWLNIYKVLAASFLHSMSNNLRVTNELLHGYRLPFYNPCTIVVCYTQTVFFKILIIMFQNSLINSSFFWWQNPHLSTQTQNLGDFHFFLFFHSASIY